MSSAPASGSAARAAIPPDSRPRTVLGAAIGAESEGRQVSPGLHTQDPRPAPTSAAERSEPRAAHDSPPRRLGGFELLGTLGRGPMGTVFKARQLELQRTVALKVLSPRLRHDPAFVERFQRAARASGRLNHPNVAAIIDIGHSDGVHYLATTYVRGESLASVLARQDHLPEERALNIALDVARALEHAHDKHVLHLDLRPTNVLLSAQEGAARVTDFALAAATAAHAPADGSRFVSPPGYRAPEVERGDAPVDGRADLFSLGVLLFEMLAGENPFLAANPIATAANVLTRSLPSLRERRPDVSTATRRALAKMTASDPADRYGSAAEVLVALDAALAAVGVRAQPDPPARRPRRRKKHVGLYVAAGVALAALLTILVVLALPSGTGQPPKAVPPAATPAPAVRRAIDEPEGTPRPTVSDAALRHLERLRAELARADDFAQRHPNAHLSQIERYEQVLADFSPQKTAHLPPEGPELRRRIDDRLARLRSRTDTLANLALKKAIDRAEDLFAKRRQAEAVRLLETFDPELKTAPVAAEVRRHADALLARARRNFEALQATARQLAAKGRLAEARQLYLDAKSGNVPGLAARADRAIAAIAQQIAKRDAERRRQEARAYPKLARTIRGHIERRRYPQALKLIDHALADTWNPVIRANLQAHRDLAVEARSFWAKAVAGIEALRPGQLVRVGGSGGAFVGLEGHLVRYRVGSVVAGAPIERLKPQEAIDYAAQGLTKAGKPLDGPFFALCALFLAAERQPRPARRALARAEREGADVTRETRLLERFAPSD